MKRAELITLAKETLNEIFDNYKYIIKVSPTSKGNGAYICVKKIVEGENYNEYRQVGYNNSVYAITGKENVVKAIKKAYANV